jgi:hypothetical protein
MCSDRSSENRYNIRLVFLGSACSSERAPLELGYVDDVCIVHSPFVSERRDIASGLENRCEDRGNPSNNTLRVSSYTFQDVATIGNLHGAAHYNKSWRGIYDDQYDDIWRLALGKDR